MSRMNSEAGNPTRYSTHPEGPVPLECDHSLVTSNNITPKITNPPTEEASRDESVSLDFQDQASEEMHKAFRQAVKEADESAELPSTLPLEQRTAIQKTEKKKRPRPPMYANVTAPAPKKQKATPNKTPPSKSEFAQAIDGELYEELELEDVYFTDYYEQLKTEQQELTKTDLSTTLIVHGISKREREGSVLHELMRLIKSKYNFTPLIIGRFNRCEDFWRVGFNSNNHVSLLEATRHTISLSGEVEIVFERPLLYMMVQKRRGTLVPYKERAKSNKTPQNAQKSKTVRAKRQKEIVPPSSSKNTKSTNGSPAHAPVLTPKSKPSQESPVPTPTTAKPTSPPKNETEKSVINIAISKTTIKLTTATKTPTTPTLPTSTPQILTPPTLTTPTSTPTTSTPQISTPLTLTTPTPQTSTPPTSPTISATPPTPITLNTTNLTTTTTTNTTTTSATTITTTATSTITATNTPLPSPRTITSSPMPITTKNSSTEPPADLSPTSTPTELPTTPKLDIPTTPSPPLPVHAPPCTVFIDLDSNSEEEESTSYSPKKSASPPHSRERDEVQSRIDTRVGSSSDILPRRCIKIAGKGFPGTQKVVESVSQIITVAKLGPNIFFHCHCGEYGTWWIDSHIIYRNCPKLAFKFYEDLVPWKQ